EQAKADARVQHIGQVEDRRQDLGDAITVRNLRDVRRVDGAQNPSLGQLAEYDDDQGDAVGDVGEARNFHVPSRLAGREARAKRESVGPRRRLRPSPWRLAGYNRPMTLPHALPHLSAVADDYDILLCDVWGVIHNGR